MREAIIIRHDYDDIEDMGSVLAIARMKGRKKLGVDKIRVIPWVIVDPFGDFIVEVESLDNNAHKRPTAGAKGSEG